MSPLRGWRPALRIARREALRSRGRSVLVLVMIALPVTGVVALDTLIRTTDVNGSEGITRKLGAADALVRFQGMTGKVRQSADIDSAGWGGGKGKPPAATAANVRAALGDDIEVIARRDGQARITTASGAFTPEATEIDLSSPLSEGLFTLESGRLPDTRDEVVVSPKLAAKGYPVGSQLTLESGGTPTVVGTVESASYVDTDLVVGPIGSLALRTARANGDFLVSKPGGVSWDDVRAANKASMLVLSREVVADPPPAAEPPDYGDDTQTITVAVLVVVMALLEVVLLAGPAFAVGARRQQRSLALIAATGGTARDVRRTVLASGVVLGAVAAAIGAVLGVAAAYAAAPVVQGFSVSRFGPFEVSARDIALIAVFGLVSALLAAVAPARLAARLDVVSVLAGRRGEGKPRLRSPLLGLLLLGLGCAGAIAGATRVGGETLIAGSTVLSVLGMVLLVPVVVAAVARLTRGLPLSVRYAVRDAARHRSRTTPAVAAVAATVVGVVALGIGATSDAEENERTYSPSGPEGVAMVSSWRPRDFDWTDVRSAIATEVPGADIEEVQGIRDRQGGKNVWFEFSVPGGESSGSWSSSYGASVLVSDGPISALDLDLSSEETKRAEAMLADGGAVVFAAGPPGVSTTRIGGRSHQKITVPAVFVSVNGTDQLAQAIVSPDVVRQLGVKSSTTSLLVGGTTIDGATEDRIQEVASGFSETMYVTVERGYSDEGALIVLLVLAGIGGILMLGGTLTATFLALSDARPDLATLAAVGADPRSRRSVAAAYAGTIGLIGAVLGAAVGFIPGIAVSFPLTNSHYGGVEGLDASGVPLPDHFLDVPWLLVLGVVVLLPLLTAVVVGLTSRSRLPMAARVG